MSNEKVGINVDELCHALEDFSFAFEHYLDLRTGKILFISDFVGDTEEEKEKIEKDARRYAYIPKTDVQEGYQDMSDFIGSVEDEDLQRILKISLNGKGAFRRFKDALIDFPMEEEMWFNFKDRRTRRRALGLLEDLGLVFDEDQTEDAEIRWCYPKSP